MNKIIQYGLIVLATLLILFFSLDIQQLDVYNASHSDIAEDAGQYAERFWRTDLPGCIDDALELDRFFQMLNTDPQEAFAYGHQLGISQTHYFVVKGSGTIASVEDEYLLINASIPLPIQIATAFIFGNAVRDGSGKVNIDDFLNMTEFNDVSIAINQLVKDSVVTALKASAKPGMGISFAGAVEISEEDFPPEAIRIIPLSFSLSLQDGITNE